VEDAADAERPLADVQLLAGARTEVIADERARARAGDERQAL